MPEIGRFFGVDLVSEDYMSISTYQFAHNNPIWKIELEGLEGEVTYGHDVVNWEKIKFFNAQTQPVGTIFRGTATLKGKFKGGTTLISLGKNYKAELSMNSVEGSGTISTDKYLKLRGKAFSFNAMIEAPAIGKVTGTIDAAELGIKISEEGITVDKASFGNFSLEASNENGNTLGFDTYLAKVDSEGNLKTSSYDKVKLGKNDGVTGVLSGNTFGLGTKVGKVTLAGSVDYDELKKAVSNFFNNLLNLVINGPSGIVGGDKEPENQ